METLGDKKDNSKSCVYFEYLSEERHWDSALGTGVSTAVPICLDKFNGTNYKEARCTFGLNSGPSMSECQTRLPFGSLDRLASH
jgi:hypothetical protein